MHLDADEDPDRRCGENPEDVPGAGCVASFAVLVAMTFRFTTLMMVALLSAGLRAEVLVAGRSSEQLYGHFCAGCHGEDMRGAKVPSLLDDTWRFGGSDEEVFRSIRDGAPRA